MSGQREDEDIRLGVHVAGGMPMGMMLFLTRAVSSAYPNAKLASGLGNEVVFLIPRAEAVAPSSLDGSRMEERAWGSKDEEDLLAFTSGWSEGGLKVSPPAWLAAFLQAGAESLVRELPDDALNYLEVTLCSKRAGEFKWIICRPGSLSPHDLRVRAERERDDLAKTFADLRAALEEGNYGLAHEIAGTP